MNSEHYISRCIELSREGLGNVQPNPMVGCVIVHNGLIIGEGFHQQYGGPHAEVNAISSVLKNSGTLHGASLLKESTLYVNLEPCVHYGKTPPCTDLILKYNIPNVVVSVADCYSEVAGKGLKKLREAGVNVTLGVLAKEAMELNKRFFTYYAKQRPYIILKWAQTIDGFIDIKRERNIAGGAAWITNEYSDILAHKWRSEEDAILIGSHTAFNDNPQLNIRHYYGKNPLRIVIDRNLTLPLHLHLFDKSQPTLVFTEIEKESVKNLEYVSIDFNNNICKQMLDALYRKNIQSVIIEGGKILLESYIDAGLWDEARVFICNKTFGEGKQAPKLKGEPLSKDDIAGDILEIWKSDNVLQ